MKWNRTKHDGMERKKMGLDGMTQDGTQRDQNETEQDITGLEGWDETGQNMT